VPVASASSAPPALPAAQEIHEQVATQVLKALGDHDFDAVEREFDDQMQARRAEGEDQPSSGPERSRRMESFSRTRS
jgi:hypothetical protein